MNKELTALQPGLHDRSEQGQETRRPFIPARAFKGSKEIYVWTPEVDLLLCCARTRVNAENALYIQALAHEEINWNDLLRMARLHGLMSLLYLHLTANGSESVPPDTLKELGKHFEANRRRNLFLAGELTRVLYKFELSGIHAIPFKGPALAAEVYGDLSLREFTDLDVLVRRKDILRARDIMRNLGYRPQISFFDKHRETYLQSRYELPFVSHDGRVQIELQWEIVPKYFNLSLARLQFWDGNDRKDGQGSGFPTCSPEDMLLLLCVHGTKHLWDRLRWICDVAEFVRTYQNLDWQGVAEKARRLGSLRMLALGLFLAENLLEAELPDDVCQHINFDSTVRRLAQQVGSKLDQWPMRTVGTLKSFVFHLMARERATDRIKYCTSLGITTTPEDRDFLPVPGRLSLSSYLLRPVRLIVKYVVTPLAEAWQGNHR